MKIICIANEKGGVGKSMTAINLAYNLSVEGQRTLIVDNDKQGNTSAFYGIENEPTGTHTLFTDENANIKDLIKPTAFKRLDILPTNLFMVVAINKVTVDRAKEGKAYKRNVREVYKNAFSQLSEDYDYIIIDNSPTLELNVLNAIFASDEVIVPIKDDEFVLQGIKTLMAQINNACTKESTKEVSLVFTFTRGSKAYRKRMDNTKEAFLQGEYNFKRNIYNSSVRDRKFIENTTYSKKPLSVASKKNQATIDYKNLTEEILMKA